jgi:DNA-binding GntR family transcriptional regulator
VTGEKAPPTAKDRAYDFVKAQILRGRYPGGELISEGDVATALEMSRTPVREAFLRLEGEGLLRLYPKRGALVVPVSPDEVKAVLEARSVLEHFAIDKLLSEPPAVRETLGARLDEHLKRQRSTADDDVSAFLEEDRLFHTSLLAAAGNSLLTQFYVSLRDRQVRMIAESVVSAPGRRQSILSEHAGIAAAVAAGDVGGALAAVHAHIAGTRRALGLA